jgi:hypothetical protein
MNSGSAIPAFRCHVTVCFFFLRSLYSVNIIWSSYSIHSFQRQRDKQPSSAAVLQKLCSSLVSWGGVRLSSRGTLASNWPIVPAPDDRLWVWSGRWNGNWQGKPKYSEKSYPGATLSTTNPTWADLGSKPGRRGGKPATKRLSYGTTHKTEVLILCLEFNKRQLTLYLWT